MERYVRVLLSPGVLPWLIALAAAIVLGTAHLLQSLGWPPCELCLRQRIPYWIGIALALVAGFTALPRVDLKLLSALAMAATALTFAAGAGLAIQHIGVEEHWWKSACSSGGGGQISDLLKDFGRPIVRCDEKRPFLFGLTLAVYNLLTSTALAAAATSIPARIVMNRLRREAS